MKKAACLAFSVLICLAGCGSPEPEKPKVETKAKEEAPPKPEAPKGLGISQAKLMEGVNGSPLEQLEGKGADGTNVYKGGIADEPGKSVNLIVYGSPQVVTYVYFTAAIPYADFPDAEKYPDFMKRNIKVQDTLLTNIFGSVPPDVKAAADWAKDNAKKEKVVSVNGKAVKVKYDDKAISYDIK
jgi:hypothetical protein